MDITDDLKVVQPGIVPVYEDTGGRTLVNARELHSFLGSRQEFAHWIKGKVEKYGFISDEDYLIILSNSVGGGVGKPKVDYLLTLNTAKEIALVENNDMGRLIRKYFIACEKKLRAFGGVVSEKEAEKLRQQAKRLEVMELNVRNRQALNLKFVAEFFKDVLSDISLMAIGNEITVLLTGKRLIDLPEADRFYLMYLKAMESAPVDKIEDFSLSEFDLEAAYR